MKYVIFETKGGLFHPVLFSDHTTHSQVRLKKAKPISAGFVDLGILEVKCWGKSESLGLESRGEVDAEIIRKFKYNFGTSHFLNYGTKTTGPK